MGMLRVSTRVDTGGVSRTKQSFREECDINNILKRYRNTGMLEHVRKHEGTYADVSEITDFRDALNQVSAANEFFGGLPAKLRARFDNDTATFLDFVQDPRNLEEMEELGLIKLKAKPEAKPEAAPEPPVEGSGASSEAAQ